MFACDDPVGLPPRSSAPPPRGGPTDDDEFVPGDSTPVNAGEEPPKVPNPAWEARAKQLESEQARLFRPEVFTLASPGQMAGKERSHVPGASVVEEGGLKRVVVIVQHVMGTNGLDAGPGYDAGDAAKDGSVDAANDAGDASDAADAGDAEPKDAGGTPLPAHYITTIYIRALVGGADTVVGLYEFASTDPAPPSVRFTLPAGVTSVTAFEWCTLHGLWAAVPLAV
jgi:desulfoferrodoxin (superoxide reductase-like protein)